MPVGVRVDTITKSGPSAPVNDASGQFFVVGLFERGPIGVPIRIRSYAEFLAKLGNRPAYSFAWDQVKMYFDEGGEQAQVLRVVGSGATVGTLSLNDRATPTPVPTLKIDANSEGSWSANLQIEVVDGASSGTYRIKVYYAGNLVEDYTNLATPADAVSRFSQSNYIKVTNLGSATASPNNMPALVGKTSLSSGNDQRGSISSTDYINALTNFSEDLGDGAIAIPGQNSQSVWEALVNHCKERNRIALFAGSDTDGKAELLSKANLVRSEYAGLFAPYVQVSDGVGGVRTIEPTGFVAAARSRAHSVIGPWTSAAGARSLSNSITALQKLFSRDDIDDLDAAGVSCIRQYKGRTVLYGWASLSSDLEYSGLHFRDLLNRLEVVLNDAMEEYVFQTVDAQGKLLSAVNAKIVGILHPMQQADAFFAKIVDGEVIDLGYKVDTGPNVNTQATIAQNEIRVVVSVRISPTADLVSVTLVKVGLAASV